MFVSLKRWVGFLLALGVLAVGSGFALGQSTPESGVELAHPAHIHSGTCATLGDVVHPLEKIRMPGLGGTPIAILEPIGSPSASSGVAPDKLGESFTLVEVPIDDILAGEHAINVHESDENIGNYIACGDVAGTVTDGTLTFDLEELNGSGYSGQATLLDNEDGTTTVLLTLMLDDPTATPVASPQIDVGEVGEATVGIAELFYRPHTITILAGGSVTWVNNDTVPHTATGRDAEILQSGTIEPGNDFTQTFNTPGTYEYYCEFHPDMTGTIVVQ